MFRFPLHNIVTMWWKKVVSSRFRTIYIAAISTNVFYSENINTVRCEAIKEPIYIRRIDVEKHKDRNSVWVIYKDGVYDVTKFIVNHPGGEDKIMLGAGSDIEPYWRIYRQHYNSKLPLEILSGMRIGNLHPDDLKLKAIEDSKSQSDSSSSDPYDTDPEVSPVLIHHQRKPCNNEPPVSMLAFAWITPNDLWFIRNHHPVPLIDATAHVVTFSSSSNADIKKTYSIDDLKTKFKKHTVVSTIQCGGNRRGEMNVIAITAGSPWKTCAISTAAFGGVLLRDILLDLGYSEDKAEEEGLGHVQFSSVDGLEASITVRKAFDRHGDVLLAYEMNGVDVPASHGHPLRVIVPGHVGIRNVKWVSGVKLAGEEAAGPWQRGMAYKGFAPGTTSLEGLDLDKIQSLQEMPVQSVITSPQAGAVFHAGDISTIKGFAYSGGGKGIVRVDVSIDGGNTWKTASLGDGSQQPMHRAWAWTLWECDVEIPGDLEGQEIQVVCKAVDASYNSQPESVKGIWNLRGIINNAWHRVNVAVEKAPDEEEEE